MGEAWSDWYAMDFLVDGLPEARHAARRGEVDMGKYIDAAPHLIRTQALDCPVGSVGRPGCPHGGYTYGDFGQVLGRPRSTPTARSGARRCGTCARALGSDVAEALITAGMRLSPPSRRSWTSATRSCRPTRRSTAAANAAQLWTVFAHRGMGYYAGRPTAPTSNRSRTSEPPDPGTPAGTIAGTGHRRGHRPAADRRGVGIAGLTSGRTSSPPRPTATATTRSAAFRWAVPAAAFAAPGYYPASTSGRRRGRQTTTRDASSGATGRRASGSATVTSNHGGLPGLRLRAGGGDRPVARHRMVGQQPAREQPGDTSTPVMTITLPRRSTSRRSPWIRTARAATTSPR